MPRRRTPALTDAELRIMRVLWDRGRATVGEVLDALTTHPKPAYNTVLTLLRILESKGHVTHQKAGRAFVYVPLVDRQAARRTALSHLLQRFFDGSPELLLLNLLGRDHPGPDDLEQVRALIAESPAVSSSPASGPRRRKQP